MGDQRNLQSACPRRAQRLGGVMWPVQSADPVLRHRDNDFHFGGLQGIGLALPDEVGHPRGERFGAPFFAPQTGATKDSIVDPQANYTFESETFVAAQAAGSIRIEIGANGGAAADTGRSARD